MADDLLDCLISAAADETAAPSKAPVSFDDALSTLDNTSKIEQKKKPESNDMQLQDVSKTKCESTIHSGDTDSSDDEDSRDFENRKYNEFGRNVKHLLSSSTPGTSTNYNTPKLNINKTTWTKTPISKHEIIKSKLQTSADAMFGMRVINPLVSSRVLEDRMVGREVVLFSQLKMYVRNITPDKDWVIAGVVVHKSPVKASQNGKNYFVWTLSDLKIDLKTATVFMFGSACKELWKATVGTVVGILNPSVLDLRDDSKDQACLSINNHQCVMILGQSKDLGTCKSIKKSGERCTAFVNLSVCEFCLYHVKQEYQKCSKRSDLQSGFGGRGLTALRNRVLGKNQVFYAGKLYTAIPASKNKKQVAKDQQRLNALAGFSTNSRTPAKSQKQKQAAQLELSVRERQRDLERLKQLGINTELNLDCRIVKFDAGLSRDVSVEDSKNLALDVICKLKKSNKNKVESKTLRKQRTEKENAQVEKDADISSSCTGLKIQDEYENEKSTKEKFNQPDQKKENQYFSTSEPNDDIDVLNTGIRSETIRSDMEGKINKLKFDTRTLWNEKNLPKQKTSKTIVDLDIDFSKVISNNRKFTNKNDLLETKLKKLYDNKNVTKSVQSTKALTRATFDDLDIDLNSYTENTFAAQTEQALSNNYKTETSKSTQALTEQALSMTSQSLGVLTKQNLVESELDLNSQTSKSRNLSSIPFLSGSANTQIDLTTPIQIKGATKAKKNALIWVQKNGPIEKQDPNNIHGTIKGKKRAVGALNNSNPNPKKSKTESKIQDNDFFSKRFKKMMAATSSHTDLLERRDNEEQEKYFEKLEMKERMEEKMLSTYRVPCKAIKCLICKYTSFSASELCKAERHPLKVFDAIKRFFKCRNCQNRTVCLSVVPIDACKNCGSSKWEKTSMMKEKKAEIAAPKLSIRGGEQTFVNSVIMDHNLDLMLPDD